MVIRKGFEQSLRWLHDDVLVLGSISTSKFRDWIKGDSHFLFNISDYLTKSTEFFAVLSDCHLIREQKLDLLSMVEEALIESVKILKERDMEGSQRLIAYDARVNEKRFAIENDTLTLIALQQPMASDMRTLAAVLEIVTELERIGDYAKGICKINLLIGPGQLLKPLVDIPRMVDQVTNMLHRSLDAFVQRDVDMARAIPKEDDIVDDLYNQVYRELLTLIMADPSRMDQATHLLWVAHNLERSGDRVVNICERIVFTVTGDMKEMNNSSVAELSH